MSADAGDEKRPTLQQNIESMTKLLAEYDAEFQAKQDKLRKDMESKIDAIKKDMIDMTLSAEPEPPVQASTTALGGTVDLTEYEKFVKHPYFTYPGRKKGTMYVMVPKFYTKFQVGWLLDTVDEVWNRYEVNQYAVLFGEVPEQIRKHLNLPEPIRVTVEGDTVTFNPEDKKFVKRQLNRHMTDWTDNSARITKGNEYTIIDQIIQSGHVPFRPNPVQPHHVTYGHDPIELRDYQEPVWRKFLKTGAVGVFHPTGSGKSYIGMAALARIRVGRRRNLVIVYSRTLADQWAEYIARHVPEIAKHTVIDTYHGFKQFDEQFGLTIYDECRRLPAHTFARLSTISTEYRMGLDATPYREDGKNHLIVSLTGFSQGLDWPDYMRRYGPGYHAIQVHLVKTSRGKLDKAKALYDPRRRTLFYSYHLEIGGKLASMLSLPFITAATENRLGVMRDNHSFVASSVFAEGVHIGDLDSIIEIDFHYGSRQEEMQLSGRLMHSKQKRKVHHIIMTYDEFDRYKKRLLSLEGNGFHVQLIEDGGGAKRR